MVQGPSLEAIETIRSPSSLESQIQALKQLKNDIVGHDLRKELVVRQGVVEPLVNILSSSRKATGKRRVAETNGESSPATRRPWTQEEETRLQATLILSSLASGGIAFVPPLLAAETPRHLLNALDAEASPKLTTAILQAVRNLAAAASDTEDSRLRESLEIVKYITLPFFTILEHLTTSPSTTTIRQLQLVVEIISLSAKDEKARADLAILGVLEAFASLLVSYSLGNRFIDYRGSATLPNHSLPATIIPDVLQAISEIVTGSNYRTQCFILAPDMREMMSNSYPVNTDSRWAMPTRAGAHQPMSGLVPQLHTPNYKSVSFNSGAHSFPALASLQPSGDKRAEARALQQGTDIEHANDVLSWLLFFARSMQGKDRLVALRLVALVNHAIEADAKLAVQRNDSSQKAKERENQLSMLAIPLAMQLVQLASEGKNGDPNMDESEFRKIQEQAGSVLALLVKSNKLLQTLAIDAGAIKRLSPTLKKTFDSVPIAKPMWPSRSPNGAQQDSSSSCRMGSRGLPPEIQHLMRCRQSALEILAAAAEQEESHRKIVLDSGIANCLIDSLKPYPADYLSGQGVSREKVTPKDGNTRTVILASCEAARSLSRSVSLLRTSLIDAGIAKPVFDLLKHHDLAIQIAATDVVCNLVLDFSPMRQDLMDAGAMKTLTQHVRQSDMSLRIPSMWALKHLVLAAPKDVKVQCLEELGVGWLVGAIQGDHRGVGSMPITGGVSVASSGGLSTPNAAGQQVNLLNPASMDVDDPPSAGDAMEQEEDEDGEIMYDVASSTHYQASQLRSTLQGNRYAQYSLPLFDAAKYLSAIREMEQNPILLAKRDDVAVQEQSLNFLQNMLNGEDCAAMFDHLIEQIGVEKIFSLLNDKLAPISVTSTLSATTTRNGNGTTSSRPIYNPNELILATIHVLCHMANGSPKHKQLLIAQKPLLQNWLPHFHHPDNRVRVMSVWTINNLTWIDDENDRNDAQRRVRELKVCGIEAAVRALVNDEDLDVRERVRTAVRQMDGL